MTLTYRGCTNFKLTGKLTWSPFDLFEVPFSLELSHFEIKIDDKQVLFRYNFYRNPSINEMCEVRKDANDNMWDFGVA